MAVDSMRPIWDKIDKHTNEITKLQLDTVAHAKEMEALRRDHNAMLKEAATNMGKLDTTLQSLLQSHNKNAEDTARAQGEAQGYSKAIKIGLPLAATAISGAALFTVWLYQTFGGH